MRAHQPSWAVYRAAVAMAALYALVLQTFLGGLAGIPSVDPAQIICSSHAGTGNGPAETPPAHCKLPCCTAAHVLDAGVLPSLSASSIVWPARRLLAAAWRPEVTTIPRAPPRASASARAPPVA